MIQEFGVNSDIHKTVVDLEWVQWNPPFEGLPLQILSKSAQM